MKQLIIPLTLLATTAATAQTLDKKTTEEIQSALAPHNTLSVVVKDVQNGTLSNVTNYNYSTLKDAKTKNSKLDSIARQSNDMIIAHNSFNAENASDYLPTLAIMNESLKLNANKDYINKRLVFQKHTDNTVIQWSVHQQANPFDVFKGYKKALKKLKKELQTADQLDSVPNRINITGVDFNVYRK